MQPTHPPRLDEPWPPRWVGVAILLLAAAGVVAFVVHLKSETDAKAARFDCDQFLADLHVPLRGDDELEDYDSSGFVDVDRHAKLRLSESSFSLLTAAIADAKWRPDSERIDFGGTLPAGAERFTDGRQHHDRHIALVPSERIVFLYWW